jgi:hypothetical protein
VGQPAPATPPPGGTITGIAGPYQRWTVSVYGSIVLCCEYGEQRTGNKSRYAYLSTDTGQTFTRVFDIGNAEGVHTHGVCYDPYWDALWLTSGDGNAGRAVYLSTDHGRTWGNVPVNQGGHSYQFTGITALPSCVLFASDYQMFNGVARIPRPISGPGNPAQLTIQPADIFNIDGNTITNVGYQIFTAHAPGSPTYLAFTGANGGNSRVLSTTDGSTFQQPWLDPKATSPTDGQVRGAYFVVGPDIHQRVYVTSFLDGRYSDPSRITLFPNAT